MSQSHFMELLTVWDGAPSCWKIHRWVSPSYKSPMVGSGFDSRMASWYFFASTTLRRPTPWLLMQAHTMTLTGCFIVAVVHSGKISWPRRRRTNFTPSLPKMLILVSSLQITLPQSSSVHSLCARHQLIRFCLCFRLRYCFYLGVIARKPLSHNFCLTVLSEISTTDVLRMLLMSFADLRRSCKERRQILRTSCSVTFGFLLVLRAVSVDPVSSKRLQSFLTPDFVAPPMKCLLFLHRYSLLREWQLLCLFSPATNLHVLAFWGTYLTIFTLWKHLKSRYSRSHYLTTNGWLNVWWNCL